MSEGLDSPSGPGPELPQDPTPQRPPPVPLPMEGSAHPRVAQESQVDDGGRWQQHQQEHGCRQQQVEQEPSENLAGQQKGPKASGSQAWAPRGQQG